LWNLVAARDQHFDVGVAACLNLAVYQKNGRLEAHLDGLPCP
jgi:hypothetical protein